MNRSKATSRSKRRALVNELNDLQTVLRGVFSSLGHLSRWLRWLESAHELPPSGTHGRLPAVAQMDLQRETYADFEHDLWKLQGADPALKQLFLSCSRKPITLAHLNEGSLLHWAEAFLERMLDSLKPECLPGVALQQ